MEGIVQALLSIAKALTFYKPSGTILPFGGATVPSGYLLCDGSSLLRADYPDLYTSIGTTWGSVDATHFTLPSFLTVTPLATPDVWHEIGAAGEPAFANSWVNYDATTFATAAFMKDSDGFVHLKGLVKSGTVADNDSTGRIFVLPAGYRPAKWSGFSVIGSAGYSTAAVYPTGGVGARSGTNAYLSIEGITFQADVPTSSAKWIIKT